MNATLVSIRDFFKTKKSCDPKLFTYMKNFSVYEFNVADWSFLCCSVIKTTAHSLYNYNCLIVCITIWMEIPYHRVLLYLCPILDQTHEGGLWRLSPLDMEPIHPVLLFQWVGPSQLFWKDPLCFPFLEPSVQFFCSVFLYVIKQCTEQMCLNHRILNVLSVDCLILHFQVQVFICHIHDYTEIV